jgi:hypothetical protein
MYDLKKTVDKISHSAEIRNIFLEYGTKWRRKSKTVYQIKVITLQQNTLWKKVYSTTKVQYTFRFCNLHTDEKGSITAKTHGGLSWSSAVQIKVEMAQKINGLLNVFEGAYDHTNDKMHMYIVMEKDSKAVCWLSKKSR